MKFVSATWLQRLNYIVVILAFAVGAIFGLQSMGQLSALVEIQILSIIFASITAIYGLVIYRVIAKKSSFNAFLVSFALFATMIVSVLVSANEYTNSYTILWYVLIFISGALGYYALGVVLFLDTSYVILLYTQRGEFFSQSANAMVYGGDFAIALLAYLFWRRKYSASASEQRASHLSSKLSTEKSKSNLLISSMGDGVIVTDIEGKIQIMNPAAAGLTGWKIDEAIGLDYHVVAILRDQSGNELGESDPFVQSFNSKQSIVSNDFVLKSKDGNEKILSIIVSPLSDDSENIQGVIAVMRDVSKEKMAERQRAEFISTASHEMRTPVAAIEGYLALAMNPKVTKIDDKARTYLDKAHSSTQHLGQLFQDLLSAAKSEDGRLSNHPIVVELGSLLETIIEEQRFTAEKKGLVLEYNTTGDNLTAPKVIRPILHVHVDPERMREVMNNLISNAIKFTNNGRVTVGLTSSDTSVQISISDTGVGIPQEDISHLFQKFYRVDNSATRTIGGTGLGLFICRNIIELYNGKIWVESEFGKGSTFYIDLPRLTQEQVQELQRQEQQAAAQSTAQAPSRPTPQPVPVQPPQQSSVAPSTSTTV